MTDDGIGGFIEGTPTERDTWAGMTQLSMGQQISYGLQTTFASYLFTFRYFSISDVSAITRIKYGSREFNIVRVNNIDEQKGMCTIIANEQR
jgi:head-tail adaptor